MPYSERNLSELPPSTKSLTHEQKLKFIEIVNSLLNEGMSESKAIPLAISNAKKTSLEKSAMTDQDMMPVIKAINEDQRIAVEVIYEPYKLDAHNQWMSAETISKACENFNKNLISGNVKANLFHIMNTEGVEILDTWIQKVDCFVGDQFVSEGTWVGKMHYVDDELWLRKKAGEFTGVSIGAKGRIVYPETEED